MCSDKHTQDKKKNNYLIIFLFIPSTSITAHWHYVISELDAALLLIVVALWSQHVPEQQFLHGWKRGAALLPCRRLYSSSSKWCHILVGALCFCLLMVPPSVRNGIDIIYHMGTHDCDAQPHDLQHVLVCLSHVIIAIVVVGWQPFSWGLALPTNAGTEKVNDIIASCAAWNSSLLLSTWRSSTRLSMMYLI